MTKCFQLTVITVQCHDCPDALVYEKCRPRFWPNFTLYRCPVGNVISILSATAEVRLSTSLSGYQKCSRDVHPTCTRSITNHSAIVICNGQRNCSFSSDVLDYPQDNITELCNQHQGGNFVRIEYNCIRSKKHVNIVFVADIFFSMPHIVMLTV